MPARNQRLKAISSTLACVIGSLFAMPIYAADYGCRGNPDANGCSISVGMGEKKSNGVVGGIADNGGSANKNRVNIAHDVVIKGGNVQGGWSFDKETNHNEVITSNNVTIGGDIGGGNGGTTANFNTVTLGQTNQISGEVVGGLSVLNGIEASSNRVTVGANSEVLGDIRGGVGTKVASYNYVSVHNNVKVGHEVAVTAHGGTIAGGRGDEQAKHNRVEIADNVAVGTIVGGLGDGVVSNNTVAIGNGSHTVIIYGGGHGKEVNNNEVIIGSNAVSLLIAGGHTVSGEASNNSVHIGDNLAAGGVRGGEVTSAITGAAYANNNTVWIGKNATIKETVRGGSALSDANNNRITIGSGAKVEGAVIGGLAGDNVHNNIVTLFGGEFQGAVAGGVGSENSTGNVLNLGDEHTPIQMNSLSIKEIQDFQTYNFYLPENVKHNDVVVKLQDGYHKLGNAEVNAYVPGNADLKKDNVVHLMQVVSPDNYGSIAWNGVGKVHQGITLTHDLASIELDETGKNLDLKFQRDNKQSVTPPATTPPATTPPATTPPATTPPATTPPATTPPATTPPATTPPATTPPATTPPATTPPATTPPATTPPTTTTPVVIVPPVNTPSTNPTTSGQVNAKTKSLLQGHLVAPALVTHGADYLSGSLNKLYESTQSHNPNQVHSGAFAQLGASNRDITTGSHVSLKGVHLDAGYAATQPMSSGNLLLGLGVEYGNSRYTAHLDDGTSGKGKAWNLGAGAFANYAMKNGAYVQGSVRGGRVSGDYKSNDFVHANGNEVSYTSRSNYVAAHVGVGKVWDLGNQNSLDTYVKYFDARTSGDSAKLSSGETYDFADVRSKRARVGAQYNHDLGKMGLNIGMAYEREFDGNVRAQYQGNDLPSPTMKGNTIIGEVGVNHQFGDKSVRTSLQGYGGRQRGGALRVGVKF